MPTVTPEDIRAVVDMEPVLGGMAGSRSYDRCVLGLYAYCRERLAGGVTRDELLNALVDCADGARSDATAVVAAMLDLPLDRFRHQYPSDEEFIRKKRTAARILRTVADAWETRAGEARALERDVREILVLEKAMKEPGFAQRHGSHDDLVRFNELNDRLGKYPADTVDALRKGCRDSKVTERLAMVLDRFPRYVRKRLRARR